MGLAVRVDGRLLCPLCVDTLLPASQQVVINRARALKGLPTTTYRMSLEKKPALGLFTFTTAAQISIHRRALRGELEFLTPPLPPPGAPGLPPEVGVRSSAHHLRAEARVAGREATGTGRMVALVAVVAAVALLAGLTCLLIPAAPAPVAPPAVTASSGHAPVAPKPEAPASAAVVAPEGPAMVGARARADYSTDPLVAWRACRDDQACPPAVRDAIADEVSATVTRSLDRVKAQLDLGERVDALALLAQAAIPADERFSSLRLRRELLGERLRQAAQDSASAAAVADGGDATATATARAAVGAGDASVAAATGPDASAAAVADADGKPVAPVTPPGPDVWTFAIAELQPAPGAMLEGALLQHGTVRRTIPAVGAGLYQVWIEASPTAGTDTLTVTVAGVATTLVGAQLPAAGGWIAVGEPVVVAAGPVPVALTAVGGPWRLGRMHISGSDHGKPSAGAPLASPWPPDPGTVTPPPVAAGTGGAGTAGAGTGGAGAAKAGAKRVMPWTPAFQWPAGIKPLAPVVTELLPSPWPSGAEPFYAAQPFGNTGLMMLKLRLARERVAGGGLVLVVNRARWDRKQIDATIEDGHAQGVALAPIRFADNNEWQTMVLAVPDLGAMADPCWLTLADHEALPGDNGFLLGSMVTVAQGAPAPADLGLLAPPLLGRDVILDMPWRHEMAGMLDGAVNGGSRHWPDPRSFDPLRVKVLSGDLTDATDGAAWGKLFTTEMIQSYHTLNHKDTAGIVGMQLGEAWWDDVQFHASAPAADNTTALVVAMPGVLVAQTPAGIEAWWSDLAGKIAAGDRGDHNHRGGFLPVLVVGSALPEDAATRQATDPVWQRLIDRAAAVGTPVIDVRPAQQLGGAKVPPAAARMLADGLRMLAYQIEMVQKMH